MRASWSREDDEGLDASPRGGPPGFMQVIDSKTLVFADWLRNDLY
ncbi:hypothetical protein [Melittangium boletus]|uniref:Pyridoxamine 5'-phosphate oxidase n=1 Tax=Melittangium boletus DSM 14713 TaxID=1294270 RepID=A0A250IER0_9BACT|nr:hypothetical protein [Melittangium boletus]ATB29710.1 pyridoxamine 5'-phosphate oxidase [Melittangium boletus DSM 14713]